MRKQNQNSLSITVALVASMFASGATFADDEPKNTDEVVVAKADILWANPSGPSSKVELYFRKQNIENWMIAEPAPMPPMAPPPPVGPLDFMALMSYPYAEPDGSNIEFGSMPMNPFYMPLDIFMMTPVEMPNTARLIISESYIGPHMMFPSNATPDALPDLPPYDPIVFGSVNDPSTSLNCDPVIDPTCDPAMNVNCDPMIDPTCDPAMNVNCDLMMDPTCDPAMSLNCDPMLDPTCGQNIDPNTGLVMPPYFDPSSGPFIPPINYIDIQIPMENIVVGEGTVTLSVDTCTLPVQMMYVCGPIAISWKTDGLNSVSYKAESESSINDPGYGPAVELERKMKVKSDTALANAYVLGHTADIAWGGIWKMKTVVEMKQE